VKREKKVIKDQWETKEKEEIREIEVHQE